MARKRGGLAGFYDRNKGAIQAVAPFVAGAVGGPLAGAAVGAAMKGLDREGKSGIGFDLGQGLAGGISGYGAGALGAGAKSMFTGKLAERAAAKSLQNLAPTDMASKIGLTPGVASGAGQAVAAPTATSVAAAPSATSAAAAPSAARAGASFRVAPQQVAQSVADAARAPKPLEVDVLRKFVPTSAANTPFYRTKEGLEFIGKGMTAGANIMGQQSAAAQAEREYEDQQRQLQARAEMMALFAPQMAGNLGMQLGGGIPPMGAGAPTASFNEFTENAARLATPEDPYTAHMSKPRGLFNLFGRPESYGNPRRNFTTGPNRRTWMNNPEY